MLVLIVYNVFAVPVSICFDVRALARRTGAPSGEKSSSVSLSDEEDEVLSFPAIICVKNKEDTQAFAP